MKIRLAERFGQWPLLVPPERMTAAQAQALGHAFREPTPRSKLKKQPRTTKGVLQALAARNNSLDGST